MLRVGFIGLGNVGEGMARNLAVKGFPLTVYDLRPEPVRRLTTEGASAATSNFDVGRNSDIVCLAVFDESQILQACLSHGDDAGVLAGMKQDGILVLHSTVSPSVIHRIAEHAVKRGMSVLDAPLTGGGEVAAREGKLTFMVGGEVSALERCRPVLQAMATSILHVGASGSGSAAKIINNYLAVSHTLLVREALRIGRKIGFAEETLLAILNTGSVGSNWSTLNWARIKAQEATYTTGRLGMAKSATKDMQLAGTLVEEIGVAAPALTSMIERVLPELMKNGVTDNGLD
jgi:3-hydroxyisobutyrate dehydrogenase-like beta-hydroxyacid dehydrogenase